MVHVTAQNPLRAAIVDKSLKRIRISPAMCAAFVKRMAYAKAVLKFDPEPALKLLADNIALRASADGIQLKVATAPRISSQSIGVVGRAQDAVARSDSMFEARVGRTSLDGSSTRQGRVTTVGETCWIVA